LLKKAWLASITLFFTISVLVISSQAAYAGVEPEPELVLKCYMGDFKLPTLLPIGPDIAFQDMLQIAVTTPNEANRVCIQAMKHSDQPAPGPNLWRVEHENDVGPPAQFPGVKMQDQILGTETGSLSHFELFMSAEVDTGSAVFGDIDHSTSGYFVGFDVPLLFPLPVNEILVTDDFHSSKITPEQHFSYHTPGIVDGAGTLVGMDFNCFMYDSEKEDPPFPGVTFNPPYKVKTKFGERMLTGLADPDVLCVQASKMVPTTPPPPTTPVGGELIPIETTSLLLAGAQSFSWMIPVILSGIGIGLFVVTRKSEY